MSGQAKFFAKKHLAVALLLTFAALGFRLFIALRLPNDEPDDGRLYARIANNVLDHNSFSIATEAPFEPTYIRLPGYPLFLAAVYKLFGRDNNTAVRVIQGVIDTLTCWLVAWLALAWTPADWQPERRRRALLVALGLAATCPFLAIYTATLLTEVWTAFFATLCALAAAYGLRSHSPKRQLAWWALAGLAGGGATSFRPDGGLFVAAVGGTLALAGAGRLVRQWRAEKKSNESDKGPSVRHAARQVIAVTLLRGALLTAGFAVALAPWTIRNARIFGIFMPIAPAQANMPDEFVPRGFMLWLKTWVDDVKYTQTVEWAMDVRAIHIEQMPAEAFDSPDERDRIAALLARYNNEPQPAPSAAPEIEDETAAAPTASASQSPDNHSPANRAEQIANRNVAGQTGAAASAEPPGRRNAVGKKRALLPGRAARKSTMPGGLARRRGVARNSTSKNPENRNVGNHTNSSDDGDPADDSPDDDGSPGDDQSGDDDSSNDDDQEEAAEPPPFTGEMTPEIDAGFMEIAGERIRRHPLRFYLIMPLRRAASLWFDTHSQYYPFQGELLPLKDLDREQRQHIWLPLFAALTWAYSLFAALGAWVMWRGTDSRAGLLMLALLVLPRIAFLATLENPEPRYVVELFTFIMAAASLAMVSPAWRGGAKFFRKPTSGTPAN
jgi:Dolichyl-phosphate-mannose-protein mannosyltransferase